MRQHEPQTMTFIEVLPVHVDPHINKAKAKENERTRQPEKVWQYKTKMRIICLSKGNKRIKQV